MFGSGTGRSVRLVAVLGFAGLLALATPTVARAEYCRDTMPDHPDDASGFTFRAQVAGIRTEPRQSPMTFITFDVTRVYANAGRPDLRPGRSIEVYSNACDGMKGIAVGDDLLISTATLDEPRTWNTVAWRFTSTGRLRHIGPVPWFTDDRRIARADTVFEALRLVAPSAAAALPTDAAEAGQRSDRVWPVALLGLWWIATTIWIERHLASRRPASITRR